VPLLDTADNAKQAGGKSMLLIKTSFKNTSHMSRLSMVIGFLVIKNIATKAVSGCLF
jgi:hypothetical protein